MVIDDGEIIDQVFGFHQNLWLAKQQLCPASP